MIIKKLLLASIILFSGSAFCMEYDLYQDKDFFVTLKKSRLVNFEDLFNLEFQNPMPIVHEESKKEYQATKPKPRGKKTYKIRCPKCNLLIRQSTPAKLTDKLLLHLYIKSHNPEMHQKVKIHVQNEIKFEQDKWVVPCLYKECSHRLQHKDPKNLFIVLMNHLALNLTHRTEHEEILKFIKEKKC